MAGFEIGGGGNEYDRYYAANEGGPKGKKNVKNGPKKLTKAQKEALMEALKRGKLKPPANAVMKYGINTPVPKYAINFPSTPGGNPKYAINFPSTPESHTKYGINTP